MMNSDEEQRVTGSISSNELKRRWKEVRIRMRDLGIDFLVIHNHERGGYVTWFTDVPAKGCSPFTIIFPAEDEMTTINPGGTMPGGEMVSAGWALRGVKKRLTVPTFRSLIYTTTYDAELAVRELEDKRGATIGLVGTGYMLAPFHDYLRKNLPRATFVEATDLVDQIKAIKSDEEIALIKKTAALQDEAMEYAKKVIQPGRRDSEIIADIVCKVTNLGSEEQMAVLGGSGPMGTRVPIRGRHYQNRMLEAGDQFTLMIECDGPGGMYTELGGIFVIGKAPAEMMDAYEMAKETQKVTLRLLKTDAEPAEIWRANNEFLEQNGFSPETRLYAHGQGYDLVERPALREDEPMRLKPRMNIAVHPIISTDNLWVWVCNNYLITESGVGECLHKTPQEIFSL
jgi:Xaa-Pro aminopeptidase